MYVWKNNKASKTFLHCRIPSASVLNQLKNKQIENDLDEADTIATGATRHKPVSRKRTKRIFNARDQEPVSDLSSGDEHVLRQSNHLNKLKEFLEKNSITKLNKENYTKNEEILIMNFQKKNEIRKKKIAERFSSVMKIISAKYN